MLDKLSPQTLEAGREHPFVEALERELSARLGEMTARLIETSAEGGAPERLYQLGGRVSELKNVIRLIREGGAPE